MKGAISRLLRSYKRESGFFVIGVDDSGKARNEPPVSRARHVWRAALFGEAIRWGEACVMTDC